MYLKRVTAFLIFLIILSMQFVVFADDNIEDEIDFWETYDILKETDVDVQKEISINSRHAVVYDRITRECIIWKKGK